MLDAHAVPTVQAFVQHDAVPAGPLHAPFVHGVVADLKTQPWESEEHVASVEVPWHTAPAAPPQVASALHVQAALPAAPVQLWCVLPQATGAP